MIIVVGYFNKILFKLRNIAQHKFLFTYEIEGNYFDKPNYNIGN